MFGLYFIFIGFLLLLILFFHLYIHFKNKVLSHKSNKSFDDLHIIPISHKPGKINFLILTEIILIIAVLWILLPVFFICTKNLMPAYILILIFFFLCIPGLVSLVKFGIFNKNPENN